MLCACRFFPGLLAAPPLSLGFFRSARLSVRLGLFFCPMVAFALCLIRLLAVAFSRSSARAFLCASVAPFLDAGVGHLAPAGACLCSALVGHFAAGSDPSAPHRVLPLARLFPASGPCRARPLSYAWFRCPPRLAAMPGLLVVSPCVCPLVSLLLRNAGCSLLRLTSLFPLDLFRCRTPGFLRSACEWSPPGRRSGGRCSSFGPLHLGSPLSRRACDRRFHWAFRAVHARCLRYLLGSCIPSLKGMALSFRWCSHLPVVGGAVFVVGFVVVRHCMCVGDSSVCPAPAPVTVPACAPPRGFFSRRSTGAARTAPAALFGTASSRPCVCLSCCRLDSVC